MLINFEMIMGATVGAIVFLSGGADAVVSASGSSSSGGAVGLVDQALSTAGARPAMHAWLEKSQKKLEKTESQKGVAGAVAMPFLIAEYLWA